MKKCPFCAEQIQDEAQVCRFCGRAQPAAGSTITRAGSYYAVGRRAEGGYAIWSIANGGLVESFPEDREHWDEAWNRFQGLEEIAARQVASDSRGPLVMGPGAILELVAGGLILVGSFMPWASIASAFGSVSLSGTDGDGKITLFLGLGIVLVAVLELAARRVLGVVAAVLAFVAGAIGGYDLVNVSSKLGGVSSSFVHASVGFGLWLVVGGAILGVIGGLLKRQVGTTR